MLLTYNDTVGMRMWYYNEKGELMFTEWSDH